MPRFFRLSPSGDAWLAQGDGPGHPLVHDGVEFARVGIQPNFLQEATAIYADTTRPALHVVPLEGGARQTIDLPYTVNALDARNGRWAAWAAPQPAAPTGLVRTWDGREFVGYGAPALCDNGDLFIVRAGIIALVAAGDTAIKALGGDGIGRLPRVAHGSTVVAWIDDPRDGPPVVSPESRGRYGQAHYVLPVLTPEGEWLVVVDADPDRLIAYPAGDHEGYVIATGVTREPDAVWCPSRGGIRIVASGAAGELREFLVRLTDPRRDVRLQPPPPPRITIADYQPREGVSPLQVTATVVAESGAGPVGRVQVLAAGPNVEASQDRTGPGVVTLPPLRIAGPYRLRAIAWSPDGQQTWRTGDHRTIQVLPAEEPTPVLNREAWLQEPPERFPARAVERERRGYWWARLVEHRTRAEAFEYVWNEAERAADGPPPAPPPRVFPPTVGLVWPMPGKESQYPSPDWLAQFKTAGFTAIRLDVPTERNRENAEASVRAVLEAGLRVLPILTWPYGHHEPQDLVDYVDWYLDRFPESDWIELGNEPWILHQETGDEYLRIAGPMAERIEARSQARVILAYDRWDFSGRDLLRRAAKTRPWPGVERVRAFIAAGPRRYAAIHPYRNPQPPSWSAWGSRDAEHAAICKDLGHARYVVTEAGWKPAESDGARDGSYLVEELSTHGRLGVEAAFIYAHIGDTRDEGRFDFGLWDVDAAANAITPRPAVAAITKALTVARDWFPTRDQVCAFKSALALDREWFSLFFLSWSDEKQDRYIARCHELGLTHVVVLFSGGYRDRFPYFILWNDIPAIRRGLTKLLRARLIPVLCAANAELAGRDLTRPVGARAVVRGDVVRGLSAGLREGSRAPLARGGEDIAAKIIAQWERTLPQVVDLLPAAIPAVEQNDFLSPDAQHRLALALARVLPDAYRLVWFTGDRCHGDHNRGTGPDGPPPAAWNPEPDPNNPGKLKSGVVGYWSATPAHANFYQSDKWHDVRAFVDDLGDVSVRVNGRVAVHGKTAPYPGMQRDVVYGEGPAEAILNGSTSYAATRHLASAALAVPGITGFGD